MNDAVSPQKVVIVGAGLVGSTTAYALINSGLVAELVLIDVDEDRLSGEVLDLNHGNFFVPAVNLHAGDYPDCRGASVVVLSAGASQKEGEGRLGLLEKNLGVFRQIVPRVLEYNDQCILLVVTNPVDVLTYATLKISGLPPGRVLGSGTLLDTARFRYLLGNNCGVDPHNIHAYVLGEHGDSEVAAWSITNVAGIPLEEFCLGCDRDCSPEKRESIFEDVRESAYRIISGKGATYYAVGLAVRRIIRALLRDENAVLPVSVLVDGMFGICDVALSLPCLLSAEGIVRVLELPLDEVEKEALRTSAEVLREAGEGAGL